MQPFIVSLRNAPGVAGCVRRVGLTPNSRSLYRHATLLLLSDKSKNGCVASWLWLPSRQEIFDKGFSTELTVETVLQLVIFHLSSSLRIGTKFSPR